MNTRSSNNKLLKHTTNTPIRKRHWFAGSMLVMIGSWITHTTTATIANPSRQIQQAGIILPPFYEAEKIHVQPEKQSDSQLSLIADMDEPALPMTTIERKTKPLKVESHTVKNGESLGIIFRKKGYDLSIPYNISKHPIAQQLVSLSAGKELAFKIDDTNSLTGISYPISALNELHVDLEGQKIVNADIKTLDHDIVERSVSAEIKSSLFLSAQKAGLSQNLIMEMVRIFGWDIDFVLDIRSGDSYHVVYNEYQKDDKKLADGNILAAEFTTQGHTYRAIRYEDSDGNASHYTPEGKSMLGTFLRSPVKFSRISSRFGKRKHPISKKWKTHKGTDYAASRGTPIRATADGKITLAGRKGGYGKTVVIRHAGRFSTLYAHMNGFAKGVRSGKRVKQGDVIGYVGSTGYSTGPHLHYEFRVDGVHRNSLTYKTPKASSIGVESKEEFAFLANKMAARLKGVKEEYLVAQAKTLNSAAL